MTCPDCKSGKIENGQCTDCKLSLEDIEVAAEFFDRLVKEGKK